MKPTFSSRDSACGIKKGDVIIALGGSRFWFWPLFQHFSGIKISITAITVIEIFIPAETSEDTENCQGCDFIKKVGEMK
jgi:hypothetical protein